MRNMTLRGNPFSMFDELLQPYKYGPRMYDNDIGTRDKPTIITRGEWVERKFKAWREEDGSYHEKLVDADDLSIIPTGPEMTD